MSEKVIEVQDLVKVYKDVTAVDKISFDVYQGEIFSLVGPNGAGKTTTVEILECLRNPTEGDAKVLGFDVRKDEKEIKKRIGVMPQEFNAFERLTVKENVELIAKIYGVKPDIENILRELGVWEAKNRQFHKLSGGMQRRVGICMALASDPELLFLDEPTTGLDPQARKETWEVIRTLKKMGKTVFLTSHYMEEVERLCDRAGVMVKGKLIATDKIRNLISKYGGGIKVSIEGRNIEKAEKMLKSFTEKVLHEKNTVIGKFKTREEASKALAQLYQLSDGYKIEITEGGMDDVFSQLTGGRVDDRGELI